MFKQGWKLWVVSVVIGISLSILVEMGFVSFEVVFGTLVILFILAMTGVAYCEAEVQTYNHIAKLYMADADKCETYGEMQCVWFSWTMFKFRR